MERQRVERRLTAILFADVVGYSRLMGADEEDTHTRLKGFLREFIEPQIAEHGGKLIRVSGDGLLAEFPSVVDALRCALGVQDGMAERNKGLPEDEQILFRIGINMGDVIADEGDIFGDSVNVAARLEGLADPAGIFVSGIVYDQVKNKVEADIGYAGTRRVKNIRDPIRIYRVTKAGQSRPQIWSFLPGYFRSLPGIAAMAFLVVGLTVGLAWLYLMQSAGSRWAQEAEPALPDRPSIAVLPFENLTGNGEQDYFADGMTDDLITDLAKVSGLFVIARNSSFVYRGRVVKISEVARDLGVRYVVEGSVRRIGKQVRINVKLIDSATGGPLWADRYDGRLEDVFALQDRVTRQIVAALEVSLTAHERRARQLAETADPDAYDAYLKGWERFRRNTPGDLADAVTLFQTAIALAPDFARAHAALAAAYWSAWDNEWVGSLGISYSEAVQRAKRQVGLALAQPTALAHQVASRMRPYEDQHGEAVAEAERAIALDSNDPLSHLSMAIALIYDGRAAEAEPHVRQAMRLDPLAADYLYWAGLMEILLGRYDAAEAALERSTKQNPGDEWAFLLLAAVHGQQGDQARAESALGRFNELRAKRGEGPYRLGDLQSWPFRAPGDLAKLRDALAKAGVR